MQTGPYSFQGLWGKTCSLPLPGVLFCIFQFKIVVVKKSCTSYTLKSVYKRNFKCYEKVRLGLLPLGPQINYLPLYASVSYKVGIYSSTYLLGQQGELNELIHKSCYYNYYLKCTCFLEVYTPNQNINSMRTGNLSCWMLGLQKLEQNLTHIRPSISTSFYVVFLLDNPLFKNQH